MKPSTKEVFEQIDDYLNCMSGKDFKKFTTEHLMCTHRTLQQSFVRFFFNVLLEYGRKLRDANVERWEVEPENVRDFISKNEYGMGYDGRNQRSAMLCIRLLEMTENGELDYWLPFI